MGSSGSARPFTDADREHLRQLHAKGWTRNDIARTLQRSPATVSKYAEEMGLRFDRDATAVATEARKADAKARRASLELGLLDDAERLRAQLWTEITYIDHGGKDYERREWTQSEPTPSDKRQLMLATAAAVDRSLSIAKHDSDQGVEAGKSLLGALANALGIAPAPQPPLADAE